MRDWTCCGLAATSIPRTLSAPESAVINPAARRMSVVFPAPSGPTSAVSAPRRTSKDTLSSARVASPLSLMKRLMDLVADNGIRHRPGRTHCCTRAMLLCQKMVSRHWLADTL